MAIWLNGLILPTVCAPRGSVRLVFFANIALVELDLSKCNTFLGLGGDVSLGLSLRDKVFPLPNAFSLTVQFSL